MRVPDNDEVKLHWAAAEMSVSHLATEQGNRGTTQAVDDALDVDRRALRARREPFGKPPQIPKHRHHRHLWRAMNGHTLGIWSRNCQ